jgi:hypothetical protein
MGFDLDSNRSLWSFAFLVLRSLLWTALLPGFVAGYVPWRFFGLDRLRLNLLSPQQLAGLFCIAVGIALLANCIWEFARSDVALSLLWTHRGSWSFEACIDSSEIPCI